MNNLEWYYIIKTKYTETNKLYTKNNNNIINNNYNNNIYKFNIIEGKDIHKINLQNMIVDINGTIYQLEYYIDNVNVSNLINVNTSNKEYALYIVPNVNNKNINIINCNKKWGGTHVTVVGFHEDNYKLKKIVPLLSKIGKKNWSLNINTIGIQKNKYLYFKSKTLDNISNILKKENMKKVKNDWHISFEDCPIPKNIGSILMNTDWSFVIVYRENGKIKWSNKRYSVLQ